MTDFGKYFIDIDKFYNSVTKQTGNYPPFNSYKEEDGTAYLEFALAGWSETELSIEVQDGSNLVIKGRKGPERVTKQTYHWTGISRRNFDSKFILQPGSYITETSFINGLLKIKIEKKTADTNVIPVNYTSKPVSTEKTLLQE